MATPVEQGALQAPSAVVGPIVEPLDDDELAEARAKRASELPQETEDDDAPDQ